MKHFIMFGLFLLSCSLLQAQGALSKDTLLNENSRALEFQISQNFTLSSFEGSTVSYKQHLSSRQAIRYGLSVSVQSQKNDQNQISANAVTDVTNFSSYSATVNAYYLCYAAPKKMIYFYYGGGPLVGYSYSNTEWTSHANPDLGGWKNESRSKSKSFSAGLGVVCGVECFVTRDISLCAEYNLAATYTHSHVEEPTKQYYAGSPTQTSDRQNTRDSFNFGSSAVKMGLLVYF